jgi:hypothetical protein
MKLSDFKNVRSVLSVTESTQKLSSILESAASVLRDVRTDLQQKKPVQIKADMIKFVAGLDVINQAIARNKSLIDDSDTRNKLYSILSGLEYDSPEENFAIVIRQADKNKPITDKWTALFQDTEKFIKAVDVLGRDIAGHISLLKTKGAEVAKIPQPSKADVQPRFI